MPYISALRPELDGQALTDIKLALRERLWTSVLLLAVLLTPLSVARAWDTGWLPIYTSQCLFMALLIAIQLLGPRVGVTMRVLLAVGFLEYTGAASLYRMGFVGFGSLWLATGAYLIGLLYGRRAGMWAMAGHLAAAGIIMAGYMRGMLVLPADIDSYARMTMPWLLFGGMMVVFPWMLLNSVGLYEQSVIRLVRESERQRAEIERMASHDPLTGLVQLRVAHERLGSAIARARRAGRKVAVLFIDLDGFKQVNDRHGHAAGDHLLQAVGAVLAGLVRETDTVGRLGGDEFLVVLEEQSGTEAAESTARSILQQLRTPVAWQGASLHVGASIGIAMYPEQGETPDDLRQAADAAMYAVKKSGRNGFAFSGGRPVHAADLSATSRFRTMLGLRRAD